MRQGWRRGGGSFFSRPYNTRMGVGGQRNNVEASAKTKKRHVWQAGKGAGGMSLPRCFPACCVQRHTLGEYKQRGGHSPGPGEMRGASYDFRSVFSCATLALRDLPSLSPTIQESGVPARSLSARQSARWRGEARSHRGRCIRIHRQTLVGRQTVCSANRTFRMFPLHRSAIPTETSWRAHHVHKGC